MPLRGHSEPSSDTPRAARHLPSWLRKLNFRRFSPSRRARRRLVRWASGRFFVVFLILVFGAFWWFISNGNAGYLGASATARVVELQRVKTAGPKPQYDLIVWVAVTPRGGGLPVRAIIDPRTLSSVHLGQRLPIRYEPGYPIIALYAGPGGDFNGRYFGQEDPSAGGHAFAVCVLLVAAFLLMTGALRLFRVLHAAGGMTETEVVFKGPGVTKLRQMRVTDGISGRALEWRLLRDQGKVEGGAFIRGHLKRGRWLVVRTVDDRLLWPATRAQPVIGTGMPRLPQVTDAELDVIGTHHRLLAAYVQIINQLNDLPFIIRCRPGQPDPPWWWLGAWRPLVGSLVVRHLRRRLRALSSALVRAAVLTDIEDGGAGRRALHEASQECKELAGTLRRSTWLALLAAAITFFLPVYATFFAAPHIHVTGRLVFGFYVASLYVGAVLLLAFYRSILCKRALFSATVLDCVSSANDSTVLDEWDSYRLEKEAFTQGGASKPRELVGQPWIPWLLGAVYALALAAPGLIGAGPAGASFILLLGLGLVVHWRIQEVGFRDFVSSLRRFFARVISALS
jgi:hypothetical protein